MANHLTTFGREVRKLRIDREMYLADLAENLGMSPAYLSNIEAGRKAIPQDLPDRISKAMELPPQEAKRLREAAEMSAKEVKLKPKTEHQADFAAALARRFDNLTPEKLSAMKRVMMGD